MKNFFVKIKCELGKAYDVAAALVDTLEDKVEEVYSISGEFDLIMKIRLNDDEDVGLFVNEHVHAIDGIKDTFTLIAFKAFK
ncbi:Lrp/AsnC ligand binding domain-containing protein [Luteithermobacter gelatinilyticus]|uniref:Lrp/AsnC ligand binding domain-containing protein n=1 Tax=Luteithermobacter gelatinilyticus TaxID=2582913 RepID=UPI00110610DD|nr:Lrp/AsnC ligand binding domain-containing protein [Luteithermobacter gelatinilyticus]